MLTALLLPVLLAGAPIAGTRVQAGNDPAVELWINNDRRFLRGDRAKVHVRAEDDGYLLVLHADPDGHLRVLFPLDPDEDNFVRGGKKYEVQGRGDREAFTVDVGSGRGTVYAAWSRAPFSFQGYVVGDHWDYRTLSAERLPREPETELTEIVRRMAGGSFDYDLLTYDVIERVVYADDYYHGVRPNYGGVYHDSYYNDPWCDGYYFRRCSGISVGIFFGTPYRRYYRPYHYAYYDPFYDPFFYDPYYYRPVRYYPYYGYYGYHRPYYHSRYRDYDWWRRDRDFGRHHTPYRFRGREGFQTDYRDRNYGFRRAVNTVYNPPVNRLSEPENATPLRRRTSDPSTARPGDSEQRRETVRRESIAREDGDDRREARPVRERTAPDRGSAADRPKADRPEADRRQPVERQRIEARRAREPVGMRSVEQGTIERRDWPVEVGRRAVDRREVDRPAVDRREVERQPVRAERQPDRVERTERPRAEPRSEPRSVDRGRAQSSPPRSSASDGGRRSSGNSDGGGRGSGGGGSRSRR